MPQRLVLDNLRAAVTKADWFDPELNPKVRSFAQHYGIALLPTKPRMPRHKGKVENKVRFVRRYEKHGSFWFPASVESESEIVIAGKSRLKIEYSDYQVESRADSPLASAARCASDRRRA